MLVTPPLVAAYATEPPKPPVHQPCELKVMIRPPWPCSIIALPAARHRKNAALRLTSCWKSQSSSVTSSRLPRRRRTAARLASTYRLPSSARARCDERRVAGQVAQVGGHARRGRCPRARPRPRRPGPGPGRPPSPSRRSSRTPRATALPMPPAAPVTMTPLPSRPAPTLQVMSAPPLRSSAAAMPPTGPARTFSLRYRSTTSSMTSMPRPGFGGRVDPAVHMLEGLGHEVVLHRVAQRLELEQLGRRAS